MAWKGSLSVHMRELRFLLNPRSPVAAGCRDFIQNQHTFLKSLNPSLSMPVRETDDPSYEPMIVAFYDFGHLVNKNVSNMSEAQVTEVIRSLHLEGTKARKADFPTLPDII